MPEETEADSGAEAVPRKEIPVHGLTMCDACGEYCDLAAPDTYATVIDDCMPLVLCGEHARRVVWGYFEREQCSPDPLDPRTHVIDADTELCQRCGLTQADCSERVAR